MAKLARKRYKGIEFPESFEMKPEEFNIRFKNCHIFKKLSEPEKGEQLYVAYEIAVSKSGPEEPSGPVKPFSNRQKEETEALTESKVPIKK